MKQRTYKRGITVSDAWKIVLSRLDDARRKLKNGYSLKVSPAWCNQMVKQLITL